MVGETSNGDEDNVDDVPDTESTASDELEESRDDIAEVEAVNTDVTQEDGEENGQGVGAVRLALVGLGDGGQETLDDLTLTLTGGGGVLLVVEVVETQDGADGSNGSKEPEGKVSLAVVVDVVDGASVEGVVDLGDGDGLAVQEGLLLFAVGVDGSVVRHCACGVEEGMGEVNEGE